MGSFGNSFLIEGWEGSFELLKYCCPTSPTPPPQKKKNKIIFRINKTANLDAATFATDIGKYFVTKIDVIQRKLDVQNVDEATPVESLSLPSQSLRPCLRGVCGLLYRDQLSSPAH